MTVYKGSVAQGTLSQGSNVFAEVYKGSEKIYEQKAKGIRFFGATGGLYGYNGLLGTGWNINAISGYFADYYCKIEGLNVKSSVKMSNVSNWASYWYTENIDGFNLHFYKFDITGSGSSNMRWVFALSDYSAVGTYGFLCTLNAQYGNPHPYSINDTSYSAIDPALGSLFTPSFDRASSRDTIWDGISLLS